MHKKTRQYKIRKNAEDNDRNNTIVNIIYINSYEINI